MISRANSGIIYPSDYKIQVKINSKKTTLPADIKSPTTAWTYCQKLLEEIFFQISNCKPSNIFVFGTLQKGKINPEDPFLIYTNSDCQLSDQNLCKNDDICSEEYFAEILLPFTDAYFPDVSVTQFIYNDFSPLQQQFEQKLKDQYPDSVFFHADRCLVCTK